MVFLEVQREPDSGLLESWGQGWGEIHCTPPVQKVLIKEGETNSP